jgi:hypothetical protein
MRWWEAIAIACCSALFLSVAAFAVRRARVAKMSKMVSIEEARLLKENELKAKQDAMARIRQDLEANWKRSSHAAAHAES